MARSPFSSRAFVKHTLTFEPSGITVTAMLEPQRRGSGKQLDVDVNAVPLKGRFVNPKYWPQGLRANDVAMLDMGGAEGIFVLSAHWPSVVAPVDKALGDVIEGTWYSGVTRERASRQFERSVLIHPLKLVIPGAEIRVWDETIDDYRTTHDEPAVLWQGLGSLQPVLNPGSQGTIGGVPGVAMPTYVAYVPNTPATTAVVTRDGLMVLDDDPASPTHGQHFRLIKDGQAMAGIGPYRLDLVQA